MPPTRFLASGMRRARPPAPTSEPRRVGVPSLCGGAATQRALSCAAHLTTYTVEHARAQAFNVIDTNNDGFITREDLREILGSLCTSRHD